jgi:hypothetical protein
MSSSVFGENISIYLGYEPKYRTVMKNEVAGS